MGGSVSPALSDDELIRSTATARTLSYDSRAGIAELTGDAVVVSSTATLKADHIILYRDEKKGAAHGNVILIQKDMTEFLEENGTLPAAAFSTHTIKTAETPDADWAGQHYPESILLGDQAEYYWDASSGVITNARGVTPPWIFTARKALQKKKGVFILKGGELTSCNLDPPHYRIRATRSKMITGQRATMFNAWFLVGHLPAFWSPFYYRSLKEKKYSFRVEPGQSARDGLTVRTIFGYPLTPNTRTKLTWDYLERTGNRYAVEHKYNRYDIRGEFNSSLLQDENPDPAPERERYDILWSHYQRLTSRLTLNSRLDVISDQTFANDAFDRDNGVRVQNAERGVTSEAGLTYQFPQATMQVDVNRRDRFETTVSSESFISKLVLPRISVTTIPLQFDGVPFYVQLSGFWVNESRDRADPQNALRYQRSAQGGIDIEKDLRIKWLGTFTPTLGFSETWQDRKDTSILGMSGKDIYVGRTRSALAHRRKFFRKFDLRTNVQYNTRFRENSTVTDTGADDFGVETNRVDSSIVTTIGRRNRISLTSGYDLRNAPRSDPQRFASRLERIRPPSFDAQVELAPRVHLFFRETYQVYPVKTPLNTAGEIQFGEVTNPVVFTQGFSYAKPVPGAESTVNFTNRIKFFLTRKWYVDAFLSYRAVGEGKLNYRKLKPTEKTINVVRDLHCWIFRASFSERIGRREASFHISLKTDFTREKSVFRDRGEIPYYPFQKDEFSDEKLFPQDGENQIEP